MSAAEKKKHEAGPAFERLPREQRSRRHRAVRAFSVSMARLPKRELELGRLLYPEDEHADVQRPRTRGECKDGVRPCPFVSCKHHLYLDVSPRTGALKLNFPDIDADALEQMPESCALDVADRNGATLEEVGAIMNLTRERIRQVEMSGLAKVRAAAEDHPDFAEAAEARGIERRENRVLGRALRRLPVVG